MNTFKIGDKTILSTKKRGVTRYAIEDLRIYRIKVESIPGFFTNVYLILDSEAVLVDVGSHAAKVISDLKRGFDIINKDFKEDVGLGDVSNVIITHGHGDHFAGLSHKELMDKRVYVHPLDGNHIWDYTAFYHQWIRGDEELAKEAGLEGRVDLSDMWGDMWRPAGFAARITEADLINVVDGQEILNGYKVYHIPGHSPGHICLKVGPFLFLGDHILSFTIPPLIPTSIENGVGLKLYLNSLRKMSDLGESLGLAGHGQTIYPLKGRIQQIESFHHKRMGELVELCQTEKNLYQLAKEYYWLHPVLIRVPSFDELVDAEKAVALEEIKSCVEYLLENNRLIMSGIDNCVPRYCSA